MWSEPSSGIKLTAYSCICWLFHRIYYDARNHKHKICILCCFANMSVLWAKQILQVYWMGICICAGRGVCRQSKKKVKKFCSRITCIAAGSRSVHFLLSLQHETKQTAETINKASWCTQIIAHRHNQLNTTVSYTAVYSYLLYTAVCIRIVLFQTSF